MIYGPKHKRQSKTPEVSLSGRVKLQTCTDPCYSAFSISFTSHRFQSTGISDLCKYTHQTKIRPTGTYADTLMGWVGTAELPVVISNLHVKSLTWCIRGLLMRKCHPRIWTLKSLQWRMALVMRKNRYIRHSWDWPDALWNSKLFHNIHRSDICQDSWPGGTHTHLLFLYLHLFFKTKLVTIQYWMLKCTSLGMHECYRAR